MRPLPDQSLAYEQAVLSARSDPSLQSLVQRAFLHEDGARALDQFRRSEDLARVRRLLLRAGVRPPARILDFGGGRGLLSAALALDGHAVVLCEPNESPVCGARAAGELLRAGASFEITTATVAELPVAAFDAVVCRAVLHHVDPLVGVLRDVRDRLVPGGVLIAADEPTVRSDRDLVRLRQNHPFVRFGVEETAYRTREYLAALEEAGFERAESLFPVAWSDYRDRLAARHPPPVAAARYAVYRVRSAVRPAPGAVRSFVARRPLESPD